MKLKEAFIWSFENDNGDWIDSIFVDKCRNSELREWRLCTNTITGECYSVLLRSEGPDDPFEHSVVLPKKFCEILANVS
jgi:hypothetical protein